MQAISSFHQHNTKTLSKQILTPIGQSLNRGAKTVGQRLKRITTEQFKTMLGLLAFLLGAILAVLFPSTCFPI